MASLEGWGSTIELHPRARPDPYACAWEIGPEASRRIPPAPRGVA